MDLGGPKLRTGPMEAGPTVVRIRPRRDVYGRVIAPARIWLSAVSGMPSPPSPADTCLPVPAAWLGQLQQGQRVHFADARGAQQTMTIVDVTEQGCWAEMTKTAYVVPGTILYCASVPRGGEGGNEASIGNLPAKERAIIL